MWQGLLQEHQGPRAGGRKRALISTEKIDTHTAFTSTQPWALEHLGLPSLPVTVLQPLTAQVYEALGPLPRDMEITRWSVERLLDIAFNAATPIGTHPTALIKIWETSPRPPELLPQLYTIQHRQQVSRDRDNGSNTGHWESQKSPLFILHLPSFPLFA